MVHLDHDEVMGPKHGMCGTLYAELEVQRTNMRAELTAFLWPLWEARGLNADNKGIIH